jgi:hypothetical protein
MVEMAAAMLVSGIVLVLMGSAVVSQFATQRRVGAQVGVQGSARKAFLILDKQVRYADVVTQPTTDGSGRQWIEWRVHDREIPMAQSPTQSRCYQWRASAATGLLQYRTWVVPASGSVGVPAWVTVSSGLKITSQPVFTTSASGLQSSPFSVPNTSVTRGHQRLGVAVTIGSAGSTAGSSFASTFTALNSIDGTSGGPVCQEVPRS